MEGGVSRRRTEDTAPRRVALQQNRTASYFEDDDADDLYRFLSVNGLTP